MAAHIKHFGHGVDVDVNAVEIAEHQHVGDDGAFFFGESKLLETILAKCFQLLAGISYVSACYCVFLLELFTDILPYILTKIYSFWPKILKSLYYI